MLALTIDVCDAATCALLHEGVAGSEKEVVRKLFLAAHELLQKGIDNFPLNGTYLAKFVDRLQEALLEPVCCSGGAPQQTLLTMMRNNQTVVERLPDEQKEFFLRHVCTALLRLPRVLPALCSYICVLVRQFTPVYVSSYVCLRYAAIYVSSYGSSRRAYCLRYAPIYVSSYVCLRCAPIYVSSYGSSRRAYCLRYAPMCVLILLYVCPHTIVRMSSHYYIRLFRGPCPHTTVHMSSCYYMCVLILLYIHMSSHYYLRLFRGPRALTLCSHSVSMRPLATSVRGLQLLVYAALRY